MLTPEIEIPDAESCIGNFYSHEFTRPFPKTTKVPKHPNWRLKNHPPARILVHDGDRLAAIAFIGKISHIQTLFVRRLYEHTKANRFGNRRQ
jgi:hypothetical protein